MIDLSFSCLLGGLRKAQPKQTKLGTLATKMKLALACFHLLTECTGDKLPDNPVIHLPECQTKRELVVVLHCYKMNPVSN